MINPAIIVIAYNREDSLYRLLNSISKADYGDNKDINLVISIDKSDNEKVAALANDFVWEFGEKTVVTHEERLGLKKHVLSCGDYVDQFENIIVLEDDLYVSKEFYHYAVAALDFVKDDKKVAGVSLYNHCLNVHVREAFESIDDGYDNYYMQFAQSWGQAYSKSQWKGFTSWLKDNEDKPIEDLSVPENVSSWSDKSWLKYYIKYIIETDKYFIYPRISYTTNFSDVGTHAKGSVTDLQVSLAGDKNREFFFSTLDESKAVYDAFFENIYFENLKEYDSLIIDLYGYKNNTNGKHLLSSKAYPYKVERSFGRLLRPHDLNVINEIEGKDLFLYDLSTKASEPSVSNALRILYNYKALSFSKMKEVIKYRLMKK